MSVAPLYLLGEDVPWWPALQALSEWDDVETRGGLLRALVAGGYADPWHAVADALLHGDGAVWHGPSVQPGVAAALRADLHGIGKALRHLESRLAQPGEGVPPLVQLAVEPSGEVAALAQALRAGEDAEALLARVLAWRAEHGGGSMARFTAFSWEAGVLRGVREPARPNVEALHGLDAQLSLLRRNTEAFLEGAPAMDALLYGPRGSGKSTVVRGLLAAYAEQGLRLVALPGAALEALPEVLSRLVGRPERFIVYVDDLAFEAGDVRYQPFKSLLEGGVEARPENVRVYATSNRRHLLQERLFDRPDPLDEDVHAWDTQHERLALADRFGLVVTFPSTDRNGYLAIVRALVEREPGGVEMTDLEGRADRFARTGNGYSGRTARQFVDAVRSGLA